MIFNMKKLTKNKIEYFKKGNYVIYSNNKIALLKNYAQAKWYFRDFFDAILMIPYGIGMIIIGILGVLLSIFQIVPHIYLVEEDSTKDKEFCNHRKTDDSNG